jgi:hypothetical protein
MENSEIIISIIKIIIYPLLILCLCFVFRKEISRLINNIVSIKGEKWEIEIKKEIKQVTQQADDILIEYADIVPNNISTEMNFNDLIYISPSAAVYEAWKFVEKKAKDLIVRRGYILNYDIDTPYKLIEDSLVKGHMVDKKTGEIFSDLRKLRNKLVHAHNYSISPEVADEYVKLAVKIGIKFDSITS